MIAEPVLVAADGRQAIGIDDLPADTGIAASPVARQPTGRMAGSRGCRHSDVADADHLAVGDDSIDMRRGKRLEHPELRIVFPRYSTIEHLCLAGRGNQLCSSQPLQFGKAARMIEMLVAIEQIFD